MSNFQKLQTHSTLVSFKFCNKHLQCEGLGYNYAPSTIKLHVQHPLQCHDKINIL